jgi:hypothetical protein
MRIYEIRGVAQQPNIQADLEIVTCVRKPVIQQIPVFNDTVMDWMMRATITPVRMNQKVVVDNVFEGVKDFHVISGQVFQYVLKFNPLVPCNVTAELILENVTASLQSSGNQQMVLANTSLSTAWERTIV